MVDSTMIEGWLAACVDGPLTVESVTVLDGGSGCTVADCLFDGRDGVLKIYHRTFDDFSQLGAVDTARKHVLALSELPRFGVPTAGLLGWAVTDSEAALLTERLPPLDPSPQASQEVAGLMARLHEVQLSDLSEELASLIGRSRRNELRVINGIIEMADRLDQDEPFWRTTHRSLSNLSRRLIDSGEPPCTNVTVIHGDYFNVNLRLRPPNEIAVIDWDLLSLGDPMWDLAFLIGADPELASTTRRNRILAAYQGTVTAQRLDWHVTSWQAFWELRDLILGGLESINPSP